MQKRLVAIVSCSYIMVTACGAVAETTDIVAVKADDARPLVTQAAAISPKAEKNAYSQADREWYAYLNRCGYKVDSEGNLIRQMRQERAQSYFRFSQRRQPQGQLLLPNMVLAD